jgi:FkbM family methyltransferase
MNYADPPFMERLLIQYARHFPVDRGKVRVVDACWRAAAGARGTTRLARLAHGRFTMPCDISEMLQRQFYFFGTYFLERRTLQCWQHEAKHAEVIFDVGANAGIFSLAAAAVQPRAIVHAFEPTPEIAARLRETVAINGLDRVRIHETAVAAHDGQASLVRWRGALDSNEGMNFIQVGITPDAERVSTVSLDSFSGQHGIERIDLLKLDVQGQEGLVLTGAKQLLASGRIGTIFMELNWSEPGRPCAATEAIAALESCGYQFAEPHCPPRWAPSGEWMRNTSEIVAKRPVLTDRNAR